MLLTVADPPNPTEIVCDVVPAALLNAITDSKAYIVEVDSVTLTPNTLCTVATFAPARLDSNRKN